MTSFREANFGGCNTAYFSLHAHISVGVSTARGGTADR